MKLYITVITHEYGHNTTIHKTRAYAESEVAEFATMWWNDLKRGIPMPPDQSDLIEAYFTDNPKEDFFIDEVLIAL